MTVLAVNTALAVNEDQVSPGALGFFVVVALGVALFFLIRSMNKQIARIEAPHEEDLKQAEWELSQQQEESGPPQPPNGHGGTQRD
jgi:flagellar biosynthesis/type III secretory pathway M-ring protein FliF/YscJ